MEEFISFVRMYCRDLLVLKKGRKRPGKKLLISAHMDEVGFIVTHITGDGLLKFDCVGGINDSAAFSKNVFVGKDKVPEVALPPILVKAAIAVLALRIYPHIETLSHHHHAEGIIDFHLHL